jgi:hypothetical protein
MSISVTVASFVCRAQILRFTLGLKCGVLFCTLHTRVGIHEKATLLTVYSNSYSKSWLSMICFFEYEYIILSYRILLLE